ncbi:hypothetical protein V6N13_016155 [Hibiscus sabdariffa]|uniref:RING-type E3 ubiquitin transferase n=2 Tax=Hibiscus sabdariffa TaxID=183260 RepID=A0ABR2NEV7_9ROSI
MAEATNSRREDFEEAMRHAKAEKDALEASLREMMRDPHLAVDGFTYEAKHVRGWFDSGQDTSPMKIDKMAHCNLVPNLALRSGIQEWLQHH